MRISTAEFVAIMAMLVATVAISIDGLLPALSIIAEELTPLRPNNAQIILSSFVAGMAIGTLIVGPLSDSYGRKTIIYCGAFIYILTSAVCVVSQSLELILVARFLQGVGASAPRVVAQALVRDFYKGREMARISSFIMIVFALVPAVAPLLGSFVMFAYDWRAIFFMFIAGANFSWHFFFWRNNSLTHYLNDQEFKAYTKILLAISVFVILTLFFSNFLDNNFIITGLFQAVSITTTTGFTTSEFASWPGAIPVVLILASFIGGSAGSTAGGIKVIRFLLIYKQGVREIQRLVHPNAEIPVKLGNNAISYRVVDAVWGFFSIYFIIFALMMIAMIMAVLDQVTAISAVAAPLNNLGPGLGEVANGFMLMPAIAKWIAIIGMLLGRLEIFTLLVLFTPTFWRH